MCTCRACAQLFALPAWGKVVALVLVAAPIVLLGGALLQRLTGLSWQDAAKKAYFVMNDVPGARAGALAACATRGTSVA